MAFLPIYLVLWRTCGLKIKPNFSLHGASQNSRILLACLCGFLWTCWRSDLSVICNPICPMEQILQKAKKTLRWDGILPFIKTFLHSGVLIYTSWTATNEIFHPTIYLFCSLTVPVILQRSYYFWFYSFRIFLVCSCRTTWLHQLFSTAWSCISTSANYFCPNKSHEHSLLLVIPIKQLSSLWGVIHDFPCSS